MEPSSRSTSPMYVHPCNVSAHHNMPEPHILCVCPPCLGELDDKDLYAVGEDLYAASVAAMASSALEVL